MAELPKSVIARMRSQAAPQEHPDADLLAAFAEQALTGRERENVLAHLAICTTCRETVALAAPEPVATQPAAVFAPWYRRPRIFAWAGTLATLVVMASLIVNYGKEQSTRRMVSDATPAKVAVAPTENKPAAPATQNEVAKGGLGRLDKAPAAKAEPANALPKQKTLHEEHARDATSAILQSPAKDQKKADGGTLQNQYSVMKEAAPRPAAPPPPTAPAAAAQAAGAIADKQQVTVSAESAAVESTAGAARSQNTDLAANQSVVGGMAKRKAAKIAASAPAARWSISDKGKLQRSFDQGQTWQVVSMEEPTVFRALAVVGNDVWAGGNGGALFHSADGGATWTKQNLPGTFKDLVSLQFTDAQHGTARTGDGIVWSTSDGGQHWSKQ